MWKKFIPLLLIGIGVSFFGINFYSMSQGLLAYEEPTITEDDFYTEGNSIEEEETLYEDLDQDDILYKGKPELGDKIGELTIPKLNRTLPIIHGTTEEVLKKGVGHYEKSALPGEKNNSILSGHRDTVFRGLGEVGINDKLIVTTEAGEFLFKVRKVRIVEKDDRTVIVPKPSSTLTITTCYPFSYIGHAPQRYILIAELISKK